MRQQNFSEAAYRIKDRQTRKERFLDTMNQVIPWLRLKALIAAHYPNKYMGVVYIDSINSMLMFVAPLKPVCLVY